MSDYNPETFKAGEMDTSAQSATFDGFMKVCVYTTVAVAIVCIFLLIVGV